MPRRFWIAALSLWPGLPQVWSGQEVMGLILAGLFAATLNAAIVAQFIWTEALSPALTTFVTMLAVGTWVAGLGYTLWWIWRCHPERYRLEIERLYREATEQYLRGRWNDARRRFEQILTMDETERLVRCRMDALLDELERARAVRSPG